MPEAPDECANCGAAIPRRAKACPACGADERTGWREAGVYDGLDLPDEAFRDEGEQRGAASSSRHARARDVNGLRWYWWCVGVALLVLFTFGAMALL